ncbi:MAG: acetyl-CoA decarbonylase/synthase complex subunit gamma [Deltaproteobacteria bacterium]|nr:acetyl-CoA decarbonylase/synthase complex subunit gamma [Deltaproteobacteria bacterium]
MALSGIQIFKFLPKTNCGECGVPTCLAFAMSLAAGKAELAKCPYVSEASKAALSEASAPPIRTVVIGSGDSAVKVGGETVLFRHEKTFVNRPGLALLLTDTMEDAEIAARVKRFGELRYPRVGLILKGELLAIESKSGDATKFKALVDKVKDVPEANFVLIANDVALLKAGAQALAGKKPLLCAATAANIDAVGALAKETACPVVVRAESLDGVAALTAKLEAMGVKDIVIDTGSRKIREAFIDQLALRRGALSGKNKAWGYPSIVFPNEMTQDPIMESLYAATFVAKYGGIIVLSDFRGETLFPILLERLNIYADPQRPMVTEPKVYEIGNVTENSPLLVTSNFALTYFIVSGEIEASRVGAYLLVVDTEGLSVLTAWAAGKFAGDLVGAALKKSGIADRTKNRKVVIPGLAAIISGDLEEELGPDWNVIIGPREASHIVPFLKQMVA